MIRTQGCVSLLQYEHGAINSSGIPPLPAAFTTAARYFISFVFFCLLHSSFYPFFISSALFLFFSSLFSPFFILFLTSHHLLFCPSFLSTALLSFISLLFHFLFYFLSFLLLSFILLLLFYGRNSWRQELKRRKRLKSEKEARSIMR